MLLRFIDRGESQAPMNTPRKDDLIEQNLYEIPVCSICMDELTENVASLACGHCFHFQCIDQNFEYQGTCPNCKKRAGRQEVRSLHYPVIQNTKANAHLRTLLSSLNISERKQVEQLLREIKLQAEKVQKLRGQMTQTEKQIVTQSVTITKLRSQLNSKYTETNLLRKENLQLIRNQQGMNQSLLDSQQSESRLRVSLDKYHKQEKNFQQFRRFKNIMNDTSQEIVNYKEELEKKETSGEEMARLFYNMLLMKNLDFLKNKERLREYPDRMEEKEKEIIRQRNALEGLKKDMKEMGEKRNAERRKYEELKVKYRAVCEKAKQSGLNNKECPEMDDSSNGFMNLVKSQPTQPKAEPMLVQAVFKKPAFSASSSIGGFRKKDDRTKLY